MKYTSDHDWVRKDDNSYIVGITPFAVEQLGDIVFIELPELGIEIEQSAEIAVIESVKAASEIISPISGKIIEINEELTENPSMVNEDPAGKGWLFKIESSSSEEYDQLLDENDYQKLISS